MKRFQSNSLLEAIALCLNQNREVNFRAEKTIGAKGIDIIVTVRESVLVGTATPSAITRQVNRIINAQGIRNLGIPDAWTEAVDLAREDFEQEDKQI